MKPTFPILLALGAACAASLSNHATAQDPTGIPEVKDMKKTESGLEYGVITAGSNEPGPGRDDVVEVHYTGWLTDGTKFDSSRDRGTPASFGVTQVIKGWTEGLQLMSPGARYKFVIPGDIAYGPQGRPPKIPANATLVFDVELLKVKRMPKLPTGNPDKQMQLESGVKVETTKAGNGTKVAAGQGVKVRYALWRPTGELLDCTQRNNDYHLSGTLESLPLSPWLAEIVGGMEIGAVVRCEVPQKLYPNPRVDTIWELELVAVADLPKFRKCDPQKQKTTDSGLVYEVIEQGTGKQPKASDTVVAHYTGWLFDDGKMFDSSHARGEPTEFPLSGVIKGWTEGLQLMNVGGKYLFTIPASLGYGERGAPPTIPANATLVFFVELVDVKGK
jgi:FKBP-type peptidyl-prolyl cis-trans isomerase